MAIAEQATPQTSLDTHIQTAPDAIIDEQLAIAHEAERTAYLQNALGTDYDYAKNSGLLDMFYRDDATGEDGVMHILAGVRRTSEEGVPFTSGFHHEPSAANAQTYVDRTHLETGNTGKRGTLHRKKYAEHRYEPYRAKTIIHGLEKAASSTMYPKEYDALTVLQTIKQAYNERDPSQDELKENGKLLNTGDATMLDGQTKMKIRLIMDPKTKEIISAFPLVSEKTVLNLGRHASLATQETTKNTDAIHEHLGLK